MNLFINLNNQKNGLPFICIACITMNNTSLHKQYGSVYYLVIYYKYTITIKSSYNSYNIII